MQLKEVWDRMLINQELAALYLKHKLVAKSQLNPLVEEFKGTNKRIDTEFSHNTSWPKKGMRWCWLSSLKWSMRYQFNWTWFEMCPSGYSGLCAPSFYNSNYETKGRINCCHQQPFRLWRFAPDPSFAKGELRFCFTKPKSITSLISFSPKINRRAITSFTEVVYKKRKN